MNALKLLLPAYFVIFIFFLLRKDVKGFLLFTGIVALPFRTTYSLREGAGGAYQGWVNGVYLTLSDVSFILLFMYLLFTSWGKKSPSRLILPITFLIGASALSGVNSQWRSMTLFQIVMLAQVVFLYYFVFVRSIKTEKDIYSVVWFLTLSVLFQGILANMQFFTGHAFDYTSTGMAKLELETVSSDMGLFRVIGTVGRPNAFAAYLVPLLILNLSLLMGTDRDRKLRWLSVIVGSMAVIFTFSRGGWVSYVFSAFLLFIVLARRKLVSPRVVAGVALTSLIIMLAFHGQIETRIFGDDHNAAQSRIPLMKLAFNMIGEHPVAGVGANTFRSVVRQYATTPDLQRIYLQQVHNQFLLVFAETGIFGLAAFLWLMITILKQGASCLRQKDNRFLSSLVIGLRLAVVASIIHMMVDIYNSYILLGNLFILAGLLTAAENLAKGNAAEARAVPGYAARPGQLKVRA